MRRRTFENSFFSSLKSKFSVSKAPDYILLASSILTNFFFKKKNSDLLPAVIISVSKAEIFEI